MFAQEFSCSSFILWFIINFNFDEVFLPLLCSCAPFTFPRPTRGRFALFSETRPPSKAAYQICNHGTPQLISASSFAGPVDPEGLF